MKRLYFVRHGQSEMNVKGLYAGHTDTPLTKEGRAQAKRAGQKAKSMDIDLIVCSPLSRAYETAKIIAEEIGYPVDKIEVHPELIERNFGALEGTEWSPESSKHNNQLGIVLDIEGIEQVDDMVNRAKRVIDYVASHPRQAKHVLLVGHGGIGRALRHHAKPTADFTEPFPNAELVRWI